MVRRLTNYHLSFILKVNRLTFIKLDDQSAFMEQYYGESH